MHPSPRALPRAAVALGCAAAVLAACTKEASINRRPNGGTATATVVDGLQVIVVKAGDTYRFDPARIIVHPGPVRVALENVGKGAPHDWTLTDLPGAATALASSGETKTATFTAPAPGTYTFVCTIHKKQGQTGKLVVVKD
ncbi:MAG: cupredoxin domain-containing protein [Pseudonocardiales bacterium]|nr:cupredoxin domain-containing protein [Actinomycetota bacterium]